MREQLEVYYFLEAMHQRDGIAFEIKAKLLEETFF